MTFAAARNAPPVLCRDKCTHVPLLSLLLLLPLPTLPASSPIFCYGDLLATIQNASIFNDSKEFVDRPLVADPETVLEAFANLSDPTNVTLLRQFVEEWTVDAGSDLMSWEPPDWVER